MWSVEALTAMFGQEADKVYHPPNFAEYDFRNSREAREIFAYVRAILIHQVAIDHISHIIMDYYFNSQFCITSAEPNCDDRIRSVMLQLIKLPDDHQMSAMYPCTIRETEDGSICATTKRVKLTTDTTLVHDIMMDDECWGETPEPDSEDWTSMTTSFFPPPPERQTVMVLNPQLNKSAPLLTIHFIYLGLQKGDRVTFVIQANFGATRASLEACICNKMGCGSSTCVVRYDATWSIVDRDQLRVQMYLPLF